MSRKSLKIDLSPAEIAAIRERERISQSVMASILGVAVSTLRQWERGDRKPSGAAQMLLHVVKQRGIEILFQEDDSHQET